MTMSPYILVLAKNTNEGAKYIQRAKLPRGRWRNVASASSIRGIRFATVHCLPGFHNRPDKHSILAELRYAKCEWVDVEMPTAADAPAVDQGDGMGQQTDMLELLEKQSRALSWLAGVADTGAMTEAVEAKIEHNQAAIDTLEADRDNRAPMSLRIWNVAHRYEALRELAEREDEDLQISRGMRDDIEDPIENVSADAPKRRRRSKCGSCGELHFTEEPCAATAPIVKATPVDTASMFN